MGERKMIYWILERKMWSIK